MTSGIRPVCPRRLNKGFRSELLVGYPDRYTPDEGRNASAHCPTQGLN